MSRTDWSCHVSNLEITSVEGFLCQVALDARTRNA
jgi:hypothetical protein